MANQELELAATGTNLGEGPVDDRIIVIWHDDTAEFSVDGWQSQYPTAEHLVYSLERGGYEIEAGSQDLLLAFEEEVCQEAGDALLVADASISIIALVTPRHEVTQVARLRGDGYLPASDVASMVAPATFTAHSAAEQRDIDAVLSDMARIVDSIIKLTPMKVRALQAWARAELAGDSPVAQHALEEVALIEPTQAAGGRAAIESHLWIPASSRPPRPTMRRQPDAAQQIGPIV